MVFFLYKYVKIIYHATTVSGSEASNDHEALCFIVLNLISGRFALIQLGSLLRVKFVRVLSIFCGYLRFQ